MRRNRLNLLIIIMLGLVIVTVIVWQANTTPTPSTLGLNVLNEKYTNIKSRQIMIGDSELCGFGTTEIAAFTATRNANRVDVLVCMNPSGHILRETIK